MFKGWVEKDEMGKQSLSLDCQPMENKWTFMKEWQLQEASSMVLEAWKHAVFVL